MTGSDGSVRRRDPLARRAAATPDRTAIVAVADVSSVSYDELDASVDRVAGRLVSLGLEAGDHLGLLAGTSGASVRLIHAGWRLGLRVVPLNVRLAEPELEERVDRSDLDALVSSVDHADAAASVADSPVVSIGDGGEVGADVQSLSTVSSASVVPATWGDDDPALTMFTSGTSGRPKAVTLTMGNLLASATAAAFRLGVRPADRWLLCLPVYHMGGLAPVLRTALYGTTLVVREGFDARAVARETVDHVVTGLSLVPTQLQRVLDVDVAFADTVRTVLVGGAPMSAALVERCREADVPVHPTYGLTETASQVTTATPSEAFEHPGTVGQPLLDTTVTIVGDDDQPLDAGAQGEIVVDGPTVTPGYYDDPEATHDAICEHGLRTGDLGRLDEVGRLWVTGRRSDRIVTGGENVDPVAVATVIRDLEGVADAVVVGIPDSDLGEQVAGLVVPADVDGLDAEEVLRGCRDRLGGFEVPKTIEFVDDLPRTPSGTVDREAARDRLLDGPA